MQPELEGRRQRTDESRPAGAESRRRRHKEEQVKKDKDKDGKADYGEVIATRVPADAKRAAKRKAQREGKNLATWLKDIVLREIGHVAR